MINLFNGLTKFAKQIPPRSERKWELRTFLSLYHRLARRTPKKLGSERVIQFFDFLGNGIPPSCLTPHDLDFYRWAATRFVEEGNMPVAVMEFLCPSFGNEGRL